MGEDVEPAFLHGRRPPARPPSAGSMPESMKPRMTSPNTPPSGVGLVGGLGRRRSGLRRCWSHPARDTAPRRRRRARTSPSRGRPPRRWPPRRTCSTSYGPMNGGREQPGDRRRVDDVALALLGRGSAGTRAGRAGRPTGRCRSPASTGRRRSRRSARRHRHRRCCRRGAPRRRRRASPSPAPRPRRRRATSVTRTPTSAPVAAKLGRGAVEAVGVDVGQHHAHAFGTEGAGQGPADAGPCPRDDGDLAAQLFHVVL